MFSWLALVVFEEKIENKATVFGKVSRKSFLKKFCRIYFQIRKNVFAIKKFAYFSHSLITIENKIQLSR